MELPSLYTWSNFQYWKKCSLNGHIDRLMVSVQKCGYGDTLASYVKVSHLSRACNITRHGTSMIESESVPLTAWPYSDPMTQGKRCGCPNYMQLYWSFQSLQWQFFLSWSTGQHPILVGQGTGWNLVKTACKGVPHLLWPSGNSRIPVSYIM
jgi:hypothetical protein